MSMATDVPGIKEVFAKQEFGLAWKVNF